MVTEPKGWRYGYEYVMVCEPLAMDDHEFDMDHYISSTGGLFTWIFVNGLFQPLYNN